VGRSSPLGLDRQAHLDRAAAGFQEIGCTAELRRVKALSR
jgi:hypothetical protein